MVIPRNKNTLIGDATSPPNKTRLNPIEPRFQYIVTTTSRPPEDIHDAICLELKAPPPEKMLFGCLLKTQDTSEYLFPPETGQPVEIREESP